MTGMPRLANALDASVALPFRPTIAAATYGPAFFIDDQKIDPEHLFFQRDDVFRPIGRCPQVRRCGPTGHGASGDMFAL